MGGLDWSGLEIWVEKLGIEDVDGLIDRLRIIKLHTPNKEEDTMQPNGEG
jgi:hypothetical protein